jgi:biopolymer transport protein ExbB
LEKEIAKKVKDLEKYVLIVGTIANISVYLGLLGTIIGIIEAFSNISGQGLGGINIVIGGVSKALVTTAFGLIVAIPAVIAYNYFNEKIDDFTKSMEFYSEELISLIGKY